MGTVVLIILGFVAFMVACVLFVTAMEKLREGRYWVRHDQRRGTSTENRGSAGGQSTDRKVVFLSKEESDRQRREHEEAKAFAYDLAERDFRRKTGELEAKIRLAELQVRTASSPTVRSAAEVRLRAALAQLDHERKQFYGRPL